MEGAASKEKIVHRINLDETSICAQPVCRRGTVCLESRVARSIGQKANKRLRRTNLTYVAVICDVREVQQVLPQFHEIRLLQGERIVAVHIDTGQCRSCGEAACAFLKPWRQFRET